MNFAEILNSNFTLECIFKILLSFLIGVILGIERRSRQHIVGMRTLILISVSSTLLSILSIEVIKNYGDGTLGDPSRIISCVVSGIGFLGGGAILRQGLNIKGLTSAAIIWAVAAIGLANGAGLYIPALITFTFLFLSLVGFEKLEARLFPANQSKVIQLVYENNNIDLNNIKEIIQKRGLVVKDLNLSRIMATGQTILRYQIKSPHDCDFMALAEDLKQGGELSEFSVTE